MKYLFYFSALFILVACNQTKTKETPKEYSAEDMARIAEIKDSLMNKIEHDVNFDTVGIEQAPVKITSSRVVEREYSNYKDVALTYKNVSGKKIEAIRFKWYALNAFNEPADMGILSDGFGGGFVDDPLNPGKSRSSQWNVMSKDAKKVVKAWPTEVAFEDGTKWQSGR